MRLNGRNIGLRLLKAYRVSLVGSILTKRQPRDLDLVMVVPDREFESLFGPVETWRREGETGEWTDIRLRWSDVCVWISHELERRIGASKSIDLKIVPASLPDYGRSKCA